MGTMRDDAWSRRSFVGLRTAWPALVLVALLATAALVPPLRPVVLMGVLIGYGLARWRGGRETRLATAFAAVLPVAAILAWGAFPQPVADPRGADCTDPTSPLAVWRLLEALIGLVVVTVLVVDRRASWGELGLRIGSRANLLVAIGALLVLAPFALFGGELLGQEGIAGSFLGSYSLDLGQPAALLPALIFAVSNAFAEELAYRGTMRLWLAPSLGVIGANLAQAIVFGLAHTGQDVVGPVVPTVIAMVAAGFLAGVIARRTNSLAIVLAVHAAANIPLFFYWACRIG